jgi:phage baseplate assembly protein W
MSVNPLQPKIRGLTYPLTIKNGGLATSVDFDLVREHVLSVVETRWYERVMRANYGTEDFIFEVLKPALINSQMQSAIENNVPEIEAVNVNGDWTRSDSGLYRIVISYYVDGVLQPPLSFTLSI